MPVHVALLRAINVAGHNRVAMSDLCELLGALGYTGARSLLQSGNLVFRNSRPTGAALERLLEEETERRLRVRADYLVRSAAEWRTIVAKNPFPREAKRDPSHLVVMFLKKVAAAHDVKTLEAAIQGPEIVRARGTELYIVYPAGIGRSKLTGALIEKTLDTRGTARNWNTVLKLAALVQE
jgi:uncharacterized protein (DUF1697 family)